MRVLKVTTLLLVLSACNYRIDKTSNQTDFLKKLSRNPKALSFDTIKSGVLEGKCFQCHGAGKEDLSTYEKIKPELAKVRKLVDEGKMPKSPNPPLTTLEKKVLEMWIDMGAPEKSSVPIDLPPTEVLTATFHSVKKNIIDKKCISCHIPGGVAETSPLDTYEDILDPIFGSLKPGDPVHSPLIISINRADNDKDRMPPPDKQPRLSKEEIEALSTWILNGAKND